MVEIERANVEMKNKQSLLLRNKKTKSQTLKPTNINWELAEKIFAPEKKDILAALREKGERYPYFKEILAILAAGTLVSACLVMPGLPLIFKPFLWEGKEYKRKRLGQVLKRLHKQKLVEVVEVEGAPVVRITQNGMVKALNFKLGQMEIKKPKSWDRKWRIVIFDIPEIQRAYRDIFRQHLKNLGFYRLQESVFVYPYPCFDEVEFLRQIYQVGFGVSYILAEKIEGQRRLEEFFSL
ncbi:MAG: CRISPR-associated endonuclease Cas2 [Patescibacteria group bacterium]